MVQHLTAIYDGHNLTLEHPLNIPINTKIKVAIHIGKIKNKSDMHLKRDFESLIEFRNRINPIIPKGIDIISMADEVNQ